MKNMPSCFAYIIGIIVTFAWGQTSHAHTTKTLVEWRFNDTSKWQGWQLNRLIQNVVFDKDSVVFDALAPDPHMISPLFELTPTANHQWVVIDMDCSAGGTGELYFTNTTEGKYGGLKPAWQAVVTVPCAGRQNIAVWPFWFGLGRIIKMRFDPPFGVRCRLYSIRIVEADAPAGAPAWTFGQTDDPWQPMYAAQLKRTADALQAKALHPQAMIIVATEPFDAARQSILKLDADCPGEDILGLYWATRQEPGLYGEPIPLPANEKGGGYSLDLRQFPQWQGDVTHLAISFGTYSGETLTLRSFTIEENDPHQPFLRLRYIGFERSINRAGRPAKLRFELEHASGRPLPACTAKLTINGYTDNLDIPVMQPGEHVVLSHTFVPQSAGPTPLLLQANGQSFTRTLRVDQSINDNSITQRGDDGYDVPVPRLVKTPYEIGVYYFPGWSPESEGRWQKQEGFYERTPALGWYEEGLPEVADWHIKWAVENGITFFMYDWYWRDGKEELTAGLNDGFLKARYRDKMKFAVMWANHRPFANHTHEQLLTVTDYWIEHYLHQPNYLTIDGKPYVLFYDLSQLLSGLGSADKVRETLEAMRQRAHDAGLPGLHIGIVIPVVTSPPDLPKQAGFDSITAYHYGSIIPVARQSPYRLFLLEHKTIWQRFERSDVLPYIPAMGVGWDARPWHGPKTTQRFHRQSKYFADGLAMLKSHLDATGKQMAILEAWNEWGEGSYIEPNVEFGFEDLEAIRSTFAEPGDWPVNIGPSDVGLEGKYDLRRMLNTPDASANARQQSTQQAAPDENTIAERRSSYIQWIYDNFGAMETGLADTDGRRWALNHARLVLDRDLDQANEYFTSFGLTRDSDIWFIRFLKTFLDFKDSPRLTDHAKAHISSILRSWPKNSKTTIARWPCHHTENHDLMQLTIGMFAQNERGESMANHVREIMKSLMWRFKRGWIEWNSPCYQYHYSNPLIVLVDHAPDNKLRQAARNLLNIMLAERALLGVNGYLGGPAFRCRTADAKHSLTARKVAYLEDNRYDGFLPTVWLAFGLGEPRFDFDNARVKGLEPAGPYYASGNEPRLKQDEGMFFACSTYEPHPIVIALAEDWKTRKSFYYQGQRFMGWPDFDDLWKTQKWLPAALYYYNTPHISMGSVHSSGWICQSRYCNVTFTADPSQNLRVEMMLPDVPPHKRRYETRGRVVQHKNWLLGQGTLFEDGGIKSTLAGSWNVYKVGKGLCAHYAGPDSYHILQISDLDTYTNEAEFVAALSVPKMGGRWVYAYTIDGDRIAVDTKDMSIIINGVPRPHPPKMLHDCNYMKSEYNSGRITINTKKGSVTFNASKDN